jgi:predicted RND superfamily exporter protein
MAKDKKERYINPITNREEKFPYHFATIEDVQKYQGMNEDALLKEFLSNTKKVQITKRQRRDDPQLKELKDAIKKHYDLSEDLQTAKQDVKDARDAAKAVKEKLDDEINDDVEQKQAKEGLYKDKVKHFSENLKIIQQILEGRTH